LLCRWMRTVILRATPRSTIGLTRSDA
jgi:hypothetical protein